MARPKRPKALIPYLTVENGAEALTFYQQAFGARLVSHQVAEDETRIIHAHFKIGELEFMMSDHIVEVNQERNIPNKSQNRSMIMYWAFDSHIDVDGFLENALDAGCEIIYPFVDMFWGEYYGEIKDPFGHIWALVSPTKGKRKVSLI
ncbi:MAG: VOC family protein [Alphaproteobacteria bacterium]|nr:VOC family protein [Alphaproteobacteria bacterium]